MLCIDRLVAVPVLELVGDIGRQGHLPQPVQHLFEDSFVVESYQPIALLHGVQDFSLQQAVPEGQPGAGAAFLAGPHQRLPDIAASALQQQQLHMGSGALPLPKEPGRDDLGVVQHQAVPGPQELPNFPKSMMGNCPGALVQHQEPGGGPLLQGILGYQLLGQLKIIVGFQHYAVHYIPAPSANTM